MDLIIPMLTVRLAATCKGKISNSGFKKRGTQNKVIGTRGQGVGVWCPRELTTEHLTEASLRLEEPLRGLASLQLEETLHGLASLQLEELLHGFRPLAHLG